MLFAVKVSSAASRKAHQIQKLQTKKTKAHSKFFFFCFVPGISQGMVLQVAEGHGEGRHSQLGCAEMFYSGCGSRRPSLAERGISVPVLQWEEGIQG